MAWEEVVIDETAPSAGVPYFKFDSIGQVFTGRFLSAREEQPPGFRNKTNIYTFKTKDGEFEITATTDLDKRLKAAKLERGHAVQITYVREIPAPDATRNPMKQYKVLVDRALAPKPAAAPPPPAAADIPF